MILGTLRSSLPLASVLIVYRLSCGCRSFDGESLSCLERNSFLDLCPLYLIHSVELPADDTQCCRVCLSDFCIINRPIPSIYLGACYLLGLASTVYLVYLRRLSSLFLPCYQMCRYWCSLLCTRSLTILYYYFILHLPSCRFVVSCRLISDVPGIGLYTLLFLNNIVHLSPFLLIFRSCRLRFEISVHWG